MLFDALFVLIFKQLGQYLAITYEFECILFGLDEITSPERDAVREINLNIHLFKIEVLLAWGLANEVSDMLVFAFGHGNT